MFFPTDPKSLPQPIHETSTVQLMPLGTIVQAVDNVLGAGEFIYLAGVASTLVADLVTFNPFTGATTRGAATANSGLPLAVAMSPNVASQFGWYQVSGVMTVVNNATAAAGAAFQKATAQIGSAAVAGTQILGGAQILVANSSTFTKTCTTVNGSDALLVPNFDAIFVGCPVSGTGIQASSFVGAGVNGSPDYRSSSGGQKFGYIKLTTSDLATSRPATADGSVTVTFTRTNFSLMGGYRIAAQGQIT
jgi:hypothetical protein